MCTHVPSETDLSQCNLGYAKCTHMLLQRVADAIRFSVAALSDGTITLRYACEMNHRPADCGTLEFDRHQNRWATAHSDERVQRMAECYLEAFLARSS